MTIAFAFAHFARNGYTVFAMSHALPTDCGRNFAIDSLRGLSL
jgi:hypothetical protein